MIDREEVRAQPATFKRLKPDTSVVNRAAGFQGVRAPSDNLFASLAGAAGMAMEGIQKTKALKDEKDRVRQTSRYLRGLIPSDDATTKGYMVHALMASSNAVENTTQELIAEAKTFTGTEDEWEEKVVSSRKNIDAYLTEKYPNLDQNSVLFQKTLSNMYIEKMDNIAIARTSAKLEQEHEKRKVTYYDSLMHRAKSSQWVNPDARKEYLTTSVNELAKGLQMDKADIADIVSQAAIDGAAAGDDTWLNFTKTYDEGRGTNLYSRTKLLQNADKTLTANKNTALVAEIGIAKSELLTSYETGQIDSSQLDAGIKSINRHFGNHQFTKSEVQASHNKKVRGVHKKDGAVKVANGLAAATQVGASPLSLVNVTEDQWRDGCRLAVKQLTDAVDLTAQGMPVEQQVATQKAAMMEMVKSTVAKGKAHPDWVKDMKTITGLSYVAYEDETQLPPDIVQSLDFWKSMDSAGRRLYAKDEDTFSFLSNYHNFVEMGKPPVAALQAAERAKNNQGGITVKQVNELKGAASDVAEDIKGEGKFLGFFGTKLAEPMARFAEQEIYSKAHALVRSGFSDTEEALNQAKISFSEMNTIFDNGTYAKGNVNYLASKLPSTNANVKDIQDTFASYLWGNEEVLENQVNGGGDIEKMWIDVNTEKGTFVARDMETGDVLSTTQPLARLTDHRDDYFIDKANDTDYAGMSLTTARAYKAAGISEKDAMSLESDNETSRLRDMTDVPLLSRNAMERMGTVPGNNIPDFDLRSPHGLNDGLKSSHGVVVPKAVSVEADKLQESFSTVLMSVENDKSDAGGWNKDDKLFDTYIDAAGENIGYGHLLTEEEKKTRKVKIGTQFYSIGNKSTTGISSDTEISDSLAKQLMEQDMLSKEPHIKAKWEGYESLPLKYKYVLMNIAYNTGTKSLHKNKDGWPLLWKEMQDGNDSGVYEQMLTKYYDKTQKAYVQLTERRDAVAKALGIYKN